ncbi:B-block binding subunit of TFIIIC [Zea mays]|uniref:B-block binding subunit of TFIIIC n=1 Tax=Zea mays TaxID=4577 RepID=A0A1D6ESP7_MAIZE|nr:B-block binding subunit of TFIIIC [Zea mays]
MAENDYLLSGGLEGIGSTGKKCEVARRRNGLDTNKRKKAKKGQPDAIDGGPTGRELNIGQASFHSEPSNASNQFIPDQLMQGHYVLDHNFGPGSSQNLHDNLNQFDQASSAPTLQQQPFTGNGQLTQVSYVKLLMAYIRVRAVLGARYYRVPWKSLSDLPAPPHTCLRRMALLLKTNGKIRGAVMCLCNLLGERYIRYLEKERSLKRRRLFPQISNRSQENSLDSDCEQFNWDDFEVPEIKSALNEVIELNQTEKIDQAKRIGPVNQKNINNDNDVTKDTICSQELPNNQAIRGETKTSAVLESGFCDPEKSCGHSNAESENMEVFYKPQEKIIKDHRNKIIERAYGNHWLLRNPIRVEVKTEAKSTSKVAGQHELGPSITPLGLRYFATCACVDYWVVVLALINSLKGSPIIASHGKMK